MNGFLIWQFAFTNYQFAIPSGLKRDSTHPAAEHLSNFND